MHQESMTSRQRVLATLNHRVPDRVPIDLGGNQTGIHHAAYTDLIRHLRIGDRPVVMNPIQQLAQPCEALLERFHVDTRYVLAGPVVGSGGRIENVKRDGCLWHDLVDEFGITWSMSDDAPYCMDVMRSPLAGASTAEARHYPFPNGNDRTRFKGLRKRVKDLRKNTDYAVVSGISGVVFDICWYLRGLENWFVDMAGRPEFCGALLDRALEFWLDWFGMFLKQVGDLVDVIMIGDDLAGQTGPLFHPELYRQLVKPRQRELVQLVRSGTEAKIWYQTCGCCVDYVADLLDNGIDILNPMQSGATDMNPRKLKARFGDRVVFWGGGVDARHLSASTAPEIVREEVQFNMESLMPGGGYVFNNVHNIQAGASAENVVAAFDAAYEFGAYGE